MAYSGFVHDWPHLKDLLVSIELKIGGVKREKEHISKEGGVDGLSAWK